MSRPLSTQLSLFAEEIPPALPPETPPLFPVAHHAGALRVCVLGSGSSGNATVIRHGDQAMMIDAGLGPRTTARRLAGSDFDPADIRAVCLTHLDRDHCAPTWTRSWLQRRVRVYVHRRHLRTLDRRDALDPLARAGLLNIMDGTEFEPLPGLRTRTVHFPHDRTGTVGFDLRSPRGRIGFATDLGRVPEEMIDTFRGVDLLAIESNYDRRMQQESDRPAMLKRRIMGGAGHLSNDEAFDAVCRISERSRPAHIVLLHRSRQCNHPSLISRLYRQDPRFHGRVTLAEQATPTPWLAVTRPRPAPAPRAEAAYA